MDVLRTPDERFANLPGYPFAPHYAEVDGLRMHYVDEGPREAAPVLLLHGEPSWSYLYRKMIPMLVAARASRRRARPGGLRPLRQAASREDYTYQRHVDWMRWRCSTALDLRDVTLVGQDWGGLIGLRLAAEHEDRFARIVAANTFLPTGDIPPGDAFLRWQRYSQEVPIFHAGGIVKGGCKTELAPEVIAAYDAPFPDDRYMAGARAVPRARADDAGRPRLGAEPRAPGRCSSAGRSRSSAPSATATRSRAAATATSRPMCPARRASRTPPSPTPATSCKRTRARSLPASSSTGWRVRETKALTQREAEEIITTETHRVHRGQKRACFPLCPLCFPVIFFSAQLHLTLRPLR